jgi:serine/threonine protein kinase
MAKGLGGFQRQVALKLTHAHLKDLPGFKEELLEEAKLAVNVRHPNVVPVLDVGADSNGLFLVMEYVEGDTLSAICKALAKGSALIPMRIGMKILVDVLAGLHAAHAICDAMGSPLGLVHRDFSPQNILVSLEGVAQLSDFGIAKARTRIGNTEVGTIKGKLTYLAPEQAQCRPLDRRADVWAAGVIAWEIAAGSPLFSKSDEVSTLLKIISEPPPLLRTKRPNIDRALEQVIASALTIDREERCPDAATFRRRLIDACTAVEELADTDEVAAFMHKTVGRRLKERRARVKKMLQIRDGLCRLAEESMATTGTERMPSPVLMPSMPGAGSGTELDAAARFMYTSNTASLPIPQVNTSTASPRIAHTVDGSSADVDASTENAEKLSEPATTESCVAALFPQPHKASVVPALGAAIAIALLALAVGWQVPIHDEVMVASRFSKGLSEAASVWRRGASRARPSSSTSGATSATRPVASTSVPRAASITFHVEANAPIHGIEVDAKNVWSGSPARTVDFEIPAQAVKSGASAIVRDGSGRRRRVALDAKRTRATVHFPPIRSAPRRLASNPY